MRLGCGLVSSDLNPAYLAFFPLVRRVWREVVGVPVKLALIADAIPDDLAEEAEDILLFPPLPGVHTAFQAQCVRLSLPGLMDAEAGGGAILTSDIDMIPMNRPFHVDPIASASDDALVVYRNDALPPEVPEIAICYNAARASTWRDLTGITSMEAARDALLTWAAERPGYDGRGGGVAWNTDQQLLFDLVRRFERTTGRVVRRTDAETGHRRLDRLDLERLGGLPEADARDAAAGLFSDYHMMRPAARHHAFNEAIADLLPRYRG